MIYSAQNTACRYGLIPSVFGLKVQHTMTVTLKLRVLQLCFEFRTHAFGFLSFFSAAGAIATRLLQSFPNSAHKFGIGIQADLHSALPPSICCVCPRPCSKVRGASSFCFYYITKLVKKQVLERNLSRRRCRLYNDV